MAETILHRRVTHTSHELRNELMPRITQIIELGLLALKTSEIVVTMVDGAILRAALLNLRNNLQEIETLAHQAAAELTDALR